MRLLCPSLVVAAVVFSHIPARADTPPPAPQQIEEARRLFKVGVALLEDPDGAKYDEARVQFQKAYDLSGNWKILANLGVCQLKLERDGEAIASYEKYLAGGGANIDADEKAQIERDLAVLKAQVVTVHLTLPGTGGSVTDERLDSRGNKMINEYQAPAQTLTLGLHPGEHTLTARLQSGASKWEARLAPASEASHTFEIVEAPAAAAGTGTGGPGPASPTTDQGAAPTEGERPIPTTVWIGAGVTGALTIGAVVTGVIALGKRSDFTAINDSSHSEAEKQSAHDSAASMGLVSTILSGGALVGAGVTAYLFFSRPSEPTKEQQARTIVSPWIAPGGGGLAVRGAL